MAEVDLHVRLLRFGIFEVDLRSGELRKAGVKLKLSGQPFQVLSILLERPGELVTREEFQSQLWPDTFVDVDHNLNTAINKIREVLGDAAENPRFVETVPRRGYRFIAPVEGNGIATPPATPPTGREPGFRYRAPRFAILVGAVVLLTVVGIAMFVWRTLSGQPAIESVLQLTDDANPKLLTSVLLSDGYRIYFNELRAGSPIIAQVAVRGGETGQIISRIPSPTLTAMDSSNLLALGEPYFYGSLWLLPLPAGEPRQLRNVVAQNASLTPDGHLIFSKDTSLYIAEKDGSNPRKLCDLPSHVDSPVVSPDGKRIRLTVEGSYTKSLWEVNSDGSNPHPLLLGWQGESASCCGRWTPDGKYFVFQRRSQGRTDLWAIREGNRWSARSSSPLRLTNGPLSYELPFPGPDGKHIFAIGLKPRGELVRFDSNSQQFVPYLSGISALDATVSHDGKWMTYTTYPDGSLWRSHADGSERLQLTYPPTVVAWPRISPDGTRVAYSSSNVSCSSCVYVLPLEGGMPTKVAENARTASWSPDSGSVVAIFTGQGSANKICSATSFEGLETINLRTAKTTLIPDSREMGGPFWPSNDILVAPTLKPGEEGFLAFDFKTQKWSLLVRGIFQHWMTSIDGKYLYLMTGGDDPKILRVRLSNGTLDMVASLKSFRPVVDEDTDKWLGVATDGSPVLTRDIGTQEVYDLSVRWR
jgi:DNA-binding winged helix-turn-helix (wHTH) protein/Tol biopolymer transport system component